MKKTKKNSNVSGTEITSLEKYKFTGDILRDMREIIEVSRRSAYQAVNLALVRRNWLLGRRIAEEEMKGERRAEYGLEIIKKLSANLTKEYGKGFDRSNLYFFLQVCRFCKYKFHLKKNFPTEYRQILFPYLLR